MDSSVSRLCGWMRAKREPGRSFLLGEAAVFMVR
jgi:hypothetical protein